MLTKVNRGIIMRGLLFGVFSIFLTTPVLANGSCGYERCFGAIAVGSGGAIGRSSGLQTMPGAADAALASCGDSCSDVEVFWNACGAIAVSGSGQWAFGWASESLEAAVSNAVAACEASDEVKQSCYLREWVCSQ